MHNKKLTNRLIIFAVINLNLFFNNIGKINIILMNEIVLYMQLVVICVLLNIATLYNNSVFKDIDISLLCLVIIIILIGLVGFFNIENIIMFLFGMIFFLAGLEIGLKQKGIGLIFLVSHGGSGFGVMMAALVGYFISSPLFTDLSLKAYIYLGIMAIVGIVALGIVLLSNLSDSFKKNKYILHIVLLFFLILFIMAGMMPYILGG